MLCRDPLRIPDALPASESQSAAGTQNAAETQNAVGPAILAALAVAPGTEAVPDRDKQAWGTWV